MVKLFISEVGSEAMTLFATNEPDENKLVSSLTRLEGKSAFCRLQKDGFLSDLEAGMALSMFAQDLDRLREQPVSPSVIQVAELLVDRHFLRALDAVQLASAVVLQQKLKVSVMRFIASDRKLLEAAAQEGFEIWNPEE